MSYEITLNIPDGSTAEHHIESLAETEHISREEAALKLIEAAPLPRQTKASPEAPAIIGAGREDADLIDEVMELVMSERLRRNAEPPRV